MIVFIHLHLWLRCKLLFVNWTHNRSHSSQLSLLSSCACVFSSARRRTDRHSSNCASTGRSWCPSKTCTSAASPRDISAPWSDCPWAHHSRRSWRTSRTSSSTSRIAWLCCKKSAQGMRRTRRRRRPRKKSRTCARQARRKRQKTDGTPIHAPLASVRPGEQTHEGLAHLEARALSFRADRHACLRRTCENEMMGDGSHWLQVDLGTTAVVWSYQGQHFLRDCKLERARNFVISTFDCQNNFMQWYLFDFVKSLCPKFIRIHIYCFS